MKNPRRHRSMDLKFHLLPVASLVLVAGLLLNCEGPLTDENLSAKDRLGEGSKSISAQKTKDHVPGPAQLLVTGLQGGSGSAIGPDGALYVPENIVGRISRVDLQTGDVTTYASGLPPYIIGLGGVMDVAFHGDTGYALVTLVGAQFGTSDKVGIYRIDGPSTFTVIADIGAWSEAHPPSGFFFDVLTGVQFSLHTYRDGFLVADGHHNRVLYVTLDGAVSIVQAFGNIVPVGLAVHGNTVYNSHAGPIPHLPQDGKVVSFNTKSSTVTTVATGVRMLLDVEFGRGQTLFALSQGVWDGPFEGTPALPNTGSLVRVNQDGTFSAVTGGLNQPTSLEIVDNTAYIVTITGEIWTIEDIAGPPFGASPN
jgi:hypothetical protein